MEQIRNFPEFLKIAVRLNFDEIKPFAISVGENTTKYVVDAPLITLLSEMLAFKFKLLEPVDEEYGNVLPDGNWTGLLGMVQREEADLAFGQLFITEKRALAANFSHPYLYNSITFITDKPQYLPDRCAMLHPFSPSLWVAVVTSLILIQCLTYIFEIKTGSFRGSGLNIYGILLNQSVNFKFRNLGTKFLVYSWIIGSMFVSQSYKTVLLSYMTFPILTGIEDVRQLSKASEDDSFKCSTYLATPMFNEMLETGDESYKKIAKCLVRSNMYTDDVESFLRLTTDKKAFIGIRRYLKSFYNAYFISDDTFYTYFIGVTIRKTFCCRRTLDKALLDIAAAGIIQKFSRDEAFFLALERKRLGNKEYDANKKLLLEEFSVAFVILVLGHCLAFAVLIAEIIFSSTRFWKK